LDVGKRRPPVLVTRTSGYHITPSERCNMDSQRSDSIVGETDEGSKKRKQKKKGMTRKQLAELSGVPLGRLRRIESGAQAATFEDVVKLARALGRDPLDMIRQALIRSGDHQPTDKNAH
jgi:hypothetical protein